MTSPIQFTNSKTGRKEIFHPADQNRIGIYVCGPTVYDRAHIGNARSAVVFDLLYRLLRHDFGASHVRYVRNYTDVDDKIIARAAERWPGESPLERIAKLTRTTEDWYRQDMADLGVLEPDVTPRATEFVAQMIEDISTMITRGGAYSNGGHVFFRAEGSTGALSNRKADDPALHRIEPNPLKEHPADFVLWKPAAADEPGWDSPWGRGRPGWHIECSAMATRLLGASFDIHGGGGDLAFPHHDNEIAQAKCSHSHGDYARTWMHNGMIRVDGQKMSKSLGNFITARDLLGRMPGGAIRLALLGTHYRANLDWTSQLEARALETWRKWRGLIGETPAGEVPASVLAALRDDLNSAGAIAAMHELYAAGDAAGLKAALDLLGIPLQDTLEDVASAVVTGLVAERMRLRRELRDFAAADALRDEMIAAGVVLKDGPSGTEWHLSSRVNFEALARLGQRIKQ